MDALSREFEQTLLAVDRDGSQCVLLALAHRPLLGVSAEDDLADLKRRCAGRVALVGNLNGVQMVHWTAAEAAHHTRRALDAAAPGGGFILSDNHGEVPFQVHDEVLHAIVETTARWTP